MRNMIPGVEVGHDNKYLAKVHGAFYLGHFQREWYGLNFICGSYASGLQFDPPGTNCSGWQGLWELKT